MPPPADGVLDFDLTAFSRVCYVAFRARRWAWLALGLTGALVFGVLDTLVLRFGLAHPAILGFAIFNAAMGLLALYIAFNLPFRYFRLRARPPVRLRILKDKLEFTLETGEIRSLNTLDTRPAIFGSVYAAHVRGPPQARVMVRVRRDLGDEYFPWRKPIPYGYLPAEAVPALIKWAREAGLEVRESSGPVVVPHVVPDLTFFEAGW